jgi:hypothetical protein
VRISINTGVPPATKNQTPAWAEKIDRWYQLDEISFTLCEAIHAWDYLKTFTRPDVVLIALLGASNTSDFDFASTGANSPSKFVYTLPNVCASVLFQLLKLDGKIFCMHKGKQTESFAKSEASSLAQTGKTVWLITSSAETDESKTQRIISFESFGN